MSRGLDALRDWFATLPDGTLAEQRKLMQRELKESDWAVERRIVCAQIQVLEAVIAGDSGGNVVPFPLVPVQIQRAR